MPLTIAKSEKRGRKAAGKQPPTLNGKLTIYQQVRARLDYPTEVVPKQCVYDDKVFQFNVRTVLHALIISVRPSDRDLRESRRSDSRKTLIISLITVIALFVRDSDAQAMPYGRSLCLGPVHQATFNMGGKYPESGACFHRVAPHRTS